jgi:dTDP-4-amino-4,6-dideoxygalactose transaminase
MIRLFQPALGKAELEAVAAVFSDQWPGAGPRVREFEKAFADYIGVHNEQVIAVTSCTEGLFQAVAVLDLTTKDEVVLPTISFIGAAHAVRASGASLRLADVDPLTLNPRIEHLERAFTPQTRAIILLHFGGRMDWIQEIADLAKQRGIVLIEDSACALGGKRCGAAYGTFGDIGVWSFDGMKLVVTGDGGMIRVGDSLLREKVFQRVNLGGIKPGLEAAASNRRRWWEIQPTGWGRLAWMNDLAAAIGLVQLQRIGSFIQRRREIVSTYNSAFATIPWIRLPPSMDDESVPYFYWIQTPAEVRDELAEYLREHGVYATFRYWPLHRTALYADGGLYPGAELAAESTLLLPLHHNLRDSELNRIIDSVRTFGRDALPGSSSHPRR